MKNRKMKNKEMLYIKQNGDCYIDKDCKWGNMNKEDDIVISKEEYRYLKSIEKSYDPFWFCSISGCEGIRKECKDTCEMSIFVKEHKETAEKIFNELYRGTIRNGIPAVYNMLSPKEIKDMAKQFGVEIKENN